MIHDNNFRVRISKLERLPFDFPVEHTGKVAQIVILLTVEIGSTRHHRTADRSRDGELCLSQVFVAPEVRIAAPASADGRVGTIHGVGDGAAWYHSDKLKPFRAEESLHCPFCVIENDQAKGRAKA